MKQRLLLIEDTATLQLIYSANLTNAGFAVDVASSGAEGREMFRKDNHPVVIMDLFLPDVDGIDVIRQFTHDNPQAKIIVITSNGSVNRAVEAMRAGAFDFLLKPFSDERLLSTVTSALESLETKPEINLSAGSFYGFTGRGPMMQDVYRKIMRIALSTAPVFVVGERGAGKNVCASAIHNHSGLKTRPFIKYDGGDLSYDDQVRTLFGHLEDLDADVKLSGHTGALQKAYGGTLYIREISELDPLLQSRLATFLQKVNQNEKYTNVTGDAFPRIICSTSIDPYVLLETRKIREDLFYQLHVLTIDIPPLRDLEDDITYISKIILRGFSRVENKQFEGLNSEVTDAFRKHRWPGNISQLANLLHRIVATYDKDLVGMGMLPLGFVSTNANHSHDGLDVNEDRFFAERRNSSIHQLVGLQLDEVEAKFIEATIQSQGGSIPKAADILGVAPSTIYRKRSKR